MDKIKALQAFTAVVKTGSFTGAAEYLNTSVQLISKYITQLESQLDVRLLNRTTRRVSVTEPGSTYAKQAQQVLEQLEDMDVMLADAQRSVSGTLKISAPISFASSHFTGLINAFSTAYPRLNIDLQLNDRKVDIVEEGYDLALRIGTLRDSSLVAKRITSISLHVCAAPDYLARLGTPQTPEELKGHHYLRYSLLDDDSQHLHSILMRHGKKSGGITCNNGDVLVSLAASGMGIAIQPDFLCANAIRSGALREVLRAYRPPPLGLYALYPHRQLISSKVSQFIQFATRYYTDPPDWALQSSGV
ncbi:LysR family transcriptional regulator [Alteromonas halophila]|uniref:LysR family transcriptional regulator n=1 Tax=Alteromonas halophila TaxID=516698 RepID=A0A918JNY1_9ALTE|nr:LysR family transcriptional regulator [Alteromonas halophila]GGW90032.1 LysR family transcriptional regulator [Alteromonas halophila]